MIIESIWWYAMPLEKKPSDIRIKQVMVYIVPKREDRSSGSPEFDSPFLNKPTRNGTGARVIFVSVILFAELLYESSYQFMDLGSVDGSCRPVSLVSPGPHDHQSIDSNHESNALAHSPTEHNRTDSAKDSAQHLHRNLKILIFI